tara:strand:- start:45 stop:1094 length:1050 start_codon:yes stop_codon:yes gene_type:complete
MHRYYTKVCNFYYGSKSKYLVKSKKTLPLNGNDSISFDKIEIISRKSKKIISIKHINHLPNKLKKIIKKDIKIIVKSKKNFINLNFKKIPIIMGILNITPDSFSDGGKFYKKDLAEKQLRYLFRCGADLVDIGGESTRPGSKAISPDKEWGRIKNVLSKIRKRQVISLDTRKSEIMEKGINLGVKLINDVSGLNYDKNSIGIIKKYKASFVLQHSLGNPDVMQNKPNYKNVLLDIYDFFEKKIKDLRKAGIKHNNIILDPGIGFGKNLKHNMTILKNISIYHSLGFPILLGISRKKFIKDLSGSNDSSLRTGGTIGSSIFAMMQGVQILRVHDVNEINQSFRVFKELIK